MNDWASEPLGELARIKHGYAFKGEYFKPEGSWVLLTPGNFWPEGGLKLETDSIKRYEGPVPRAFVLSEGDLLVAMTDLKQDAPILGSVGFVPTGGTYLHNQRLGLVVVTDPARIDPRYLAVVMNSDAARAEVRATATGATVRHTAPERLYRIRVPLPDGPEQTAIVGTVTAIERLIEINGRRIERLDEAARLVFSDWCVHFRYPRDDAEGAAAGTVPREVRTTTLASVARPVRRQFDPDQHGALPFVDLGRIPRRSGALSEVGSPSEMSSPRFVFHEGETLFGVIRPNLRKALWSPFEGVTGSSVMVLESVDGIPAGYRHLLLTSDRTQAWASTAATGTKMPTMPWSTLSTLEVQVPPASALDALEQIVGPMFEQIATLNRATLRLRTIRKLLIEGFMGRHLDARRIPQTPAGGAS